MLFDVSASHHIVESDELYSSLPYTQDTKDVVKMCVNDAYNLAKSANMFFLIPHAKGEDLTLYCIDTQTGEYTTSKQKIPQEKIMRDIFIMMIIDNYCQENYEKNISVHSKTCELLCSTVIDEDKIFEYIFGKPLNE
tara:strand:+ start:657 stop:1067 length:411 start_codon:yes stop_codon:yes gene_type:complete